MEMIFDPDKLVRLGRRYKKQYAANEPFPHIVIDDFLPSHVVENLLAEFPTAASVPWDTWDSEHEVTLGLSDEKKMSEYTREVLQQFNCSVLLDFLEALTGIDGLISDPFLRGAGLHQTQPGGFLNIHVDFNYHPRLRLDRRINLLLFLNRDWKEEYNGHLELWNRDVTRCVQRIAPLFNRCVVFNTTDFSYHGSPDVLKSPKGMTRKSLTLYYYSNGRPAEERSGEHTTLFRARPGEDLKQKYSRLKRVRRFARRLLPPVVLDVILKMKPTRES